MTKRDPARPPSGGIRDNRLIDGTHRWPEKDPALGTDSPVVGAREPGLCQTMPDLGTMPFKHPHARRRQVPRLVSAMEDISLSIELQHGTNRIGRQRKGNQIVLASPQISRSHAELEVTQDQVLLKDFGSANGTFVNGERLTAQRVLQAGDLITFGDAFALRLSVDITVEEPQTLRLGGVPSQPAVTPAPPPAAIPASLERRLNETGERPLPLAHAPLPMRVTPVHAVEVRQPQHAQPQVARETAPRPGGRASRQSTRELPRHQSRLVPQPAPSLAQRQVAVLYQLSQRCALIRSVEELDSLLISVLERTVGFEQGFLAYQLPGGDWKLVMSPSGSEWDRPFISQLIQLALRQRHQHLCNAASDQTLGAGQGFRLLTPLCCGPYTVGAIYLDSGYDDTFDKETADFVSLFSDIAANAVVRCAQLMQHS